jgi:outer membrane protein OmpA-like peptidoglycan-associated protein
MPTSHDDQHAAQDQPSLPRVFPLTLDERISAANGRLRDAVRVVTWIFAGTLLVFATSGCLATRNWVNDQVNPIKGQLNQTDAKADQALAGLQNLHLEKKLVLDSNNGPTFAFGSAALSENAKREINGFFDDLGESANSTSAAPSAEGRLFVVAGHTDSVGSEDYNYQLGQQRADRVAGYLVSKEGVDPTQIRVISYGASKPVADNATSLGRRTNRRVEILVYQEKIASANNTAVSDASSDLRAVE